MSAIHRGVRGKRRAAVAVCVLAALALVSPGASSASTMNWHTPSGNIKCGIGLKHHVVCLIIEQTFAPGSCDGVFSTSGAVGRRGRARLVTGCFSGAPFNVTGEGSRTLRYGKSITRYGVTCRSSRRGMRCRNKSGHGFQLRRSAAAKF